MELIEVAGNPIPPGAQVDRIATTDGFDLRCARWVPEDAPRGTVFILHGRTEFIEKYFEVAGELLARGFAVATFDWRGQGLSARHPHVDHAGKGHVDDFTEYLADLDAVYAGFVAETCPRPIMILAHSMGGNVALRYLAGSPDSIVRAVLTAPMVAIKAGPLPDFAARLVAKVAHRMSEPVEYVPGGRDFDPTRFPFRNNPLTHDRARFERAAELMQAEPMLALGAPTLGWLDAAYRSIDIVMASTFAHRIETPTLIVAGSEETISRANAQLEVARRLPAGRGLLIEGARHEILQESDGIRREFWAAFDGFVL